MFSYFLRWVSFAVCVLGFPGVMRSVTKILVPDLSCLSRLLGLSLHRERPGAARLDPFTDILRPPTNETPDLNGCRHAPGV